MIHYIKNNILSMIKHEKWFSFILILTQCISVMVAFFASGMIYNFTIKEKAMEGTMLMISFEKDSEILGDISAEEIKKTYKDIYKLLNRKIDYADYCFSYAGKYGEDNMIIARVCYDVKKDKNKWSDSYGDFENRIGSSGRMYTTEEQDRGEKVAIAFGDFLNKEITDGVELWNNKYEIVGPMEIHSVLELSEDCYRTYIMPLMSVDDSTYLKSVEIQLNMAINEQEYKKLESLMEKLYGDRMVLPKFSGVTDIENIRANRTLIVAGAVVLVCVAINYCILYRVILEKRRKTMAVFRICGCTKWKGMLMYETELLGSAMVVYVIFACIYNRFVMPHFNGILEYMPDFYTKKNYLIIGAMYFVILLITYTILVVGMIRKTPLTLSKEGEL